MEKEKLVAIDYLAELLKDPIDEEHVVFYATRAIQALTATQPSTEEEHTEWEKEFDDSYPELVTMTDGITYKNVVARDQVKSFIHSILKDQRERIRKEIEKERKTPHEESAVTTGYNQTVRTWNTAIDTILNLPSLKD